MRGVSPHRSMWFLGSSVFVLFFSLSERCQLRACGEGVKAHADLRGVGGSCGPQISQQALG